MGNYDQAFRDFADKHKATLTATDLRAVSKFLEFIEARLDETVEERIEPSEYDQMLLGLRDDR